MTWHHDPCQSVKIRGFNVAPRIVLMVFGLARSAEAAIGIGSITMGTQDVYEVVEAMPEATIIASHIEAINHCVLSRNELRQFADERGMDNECSCLKTAKSASSEITPGRFFIASVVALMLRWREPN